MKLISISECVYGLFYLFGSEESASKVSHIILNHPVNTNLVYMFVTYVQRLIFVVGCSSHLPETR